MNSPVPVTTSSREGPRFRFGIGTHGGFLRIESVTPLGAGLGIYARVGVQINDRFAVDVQASGATIVVGGYGRLNAFFDVTLADRLSVAVGPLFAAGFGNSNAAMLGGTLRLGVHAPRNRYASGVRSSMNWGVEADLGAAFYFRSLLGPFSGGLTFFLGYQRD
ncbi:MAG: hypothetical protein Q8Q09_10880 [Deltaproteobacteria bacterium]|nr:hypothetical protein [Deltaproteobacteria bacterium]